MAAEAPPGPHHMTFLFTCVPLLGHVNPMLQPARLLNHQGHTVIFCALEDDPEVRSAVTAAGIAFHSLGSSPMSVGAHQDSHPLGDPLATKREQLLAAHERFTGIWSVREKGAGRGAAHVLA